MNKKLKVWLPLLLSMVMAVGMLAGYQLQEHLNWQNRYSSKYSFTSVQQVMDLVNLRYVDSLDLDSLETAGIEAIVSKLDPHSVYIPASSLEEVNADLHGNFSGIGIEYQMINDTLNVVYVLENGPSDKAGIKTGDQIIRVDTVSIAGSDKKGIDLRNYLRGKPGTKVKVTVKKNGHEELVEITRGNIPIPSLDAAYMVDSTIGYIRLNKFAETTYHEFMDGINQLKKEGMKKLILDLRGNGGGLLEQATNIADELLPDGRKIVSTKGNHVKTREINSNKPGIFENGELVLLIDEFSASSSEVLAGALQDNDRGIIIGRRSFGKGLVQEQFNLANGGALRMTVARYYTPTGRSIQKPYTNGDNESYRGEIMDRFHNGDAYITDSVHSKVYLTKKGKKLFDGGGITPDIIIPYDSLTIPGSTTKLYNQNLLSDYVFEIYKQLRKDLKQYRSPNDLNAKFSLSPSTWNQLIERAKKDSVQLYKLSPKTKQDIELRIKALLARYIWRNNGYFQVLNSDDASYLQALQSLQ